MECEQSPEDGPSYSKTKNEASGLRNFKYEYRHLGGRKVQLAVPSGLLDEVSDQQVYHSMVPVDRTTHQLPVNTPPDIPFMNNMDEISYWIYTKRAPCLMDYDNLIKKQNEEAQNSSTKAKAAPNAVQEVPPLKKRKKKRKLSSLNEESVSDNIQKNIYFDASQKKVHKTAMSIDELASNIDFNIKNLTVQRKRKKQKLQKSSKADIHTKQKIITSTPKPISLRRSLRQKQQSLNNGHMNTPLNFESTVVNGIHLKNNITLKSNTDDKLKEQSEFLAAGDQSCDKKKSTAKVNLNSDMLNGQFEDLSDMSGFTANYIRSTKMQSKKTPRKLRCKTSKNLIKESRHNQDDGITTICFNKAVNTRRSKNTLLNSSKDSSQNVVTLVTKNNGNCSKVDRSTSILKFLDPTSKESVQDRKVKDNDSIFQSTSRYPRRSRTVKANNTQLSNTRNNKNSNSAFNKSDQKENPEDQLTSRTRSRRNIGLTLCQPENSVLVLSNTSEDKSSVVSMNVARTSEKVKRKKCVLKKPACTQKSGQSRESVRDKSGFAACFSDSEDDSLPLMRRFFCA